MRLVIGGESLFGPLTGIGQYTLQLLKHLSTNPDIEDLQLLVHGRLVSPSVIDSLAVDGPAASELVEQKTQGSLLGKTRTIVARNQLAVRAYEKVLPFIERRALRGYTENDIFHSPNYMMSPFPGKRIVSILDLSTFLYPQYHPQARVRFVNRHIRQSLSQADHILTISERVKREIIEHFDYPAADITTTHLGADPSFRPIDEANFNATPLNLPLQYKNYFLFVSTIEPRKNLERLLNAFELYTQRQGSTSLPLVVVGYPGWKSAHLHKRMQKLQERGLLQYPGYVRQELMPALFAGARSLLFPSLYEGFGLPVIEAMQSGTAVMTSENSVMSEISGEAALLVCPESVESMATAISRLAEDDSLLSRLSATGEDRARLYSWDNCIRETFAVYQKVLS